MKGFVVAAAPGFLVSSIFIFGRHVGFFRGLPHVLDLLIFGPAIAAAAFVLFVLENERFYVSAAVVTHLVFWSLMSAGVMTLGRFLLQRGKRSGR